MADEAQTTPVKPGTWEAGFCAGIEEAAKLLDVSAQEIRLAAGELTNGEVRAVKAVLAWRARELLRRIETIKRMVNGE